MKWILSKKKYIITNKYIKVLALYHAKLECLKTYVTKYSRSNQVKFVEDSL